MRARASAGSALALAAAALGCRAQPTAPPAPPHVFVHVALDPKAASGPVSGRLIVFAQPLAEAQAQAKGGAIRQVDTGEFEPEAVAVAAREVHDLAPGQAVDLDADATAFPRGFSKLKPGAYVLQAVLDRDHSYDYGGRGPGDLLSPVVQADLPGAPELTLDSVEPARDPWSPPPGAPPESARRLATVRPDLHAVDLVSPALTRFWGRPIHMRGWVLTPPGYARDTAARYPSVYFTHGFGGTLNGLIGYAARVDAAMAAGEMPPMIWVFLDESSPTGTHEFADSVNNGPWGEALTTELIPAMESRYRMDARPSGRFLQGHSSGGWATLWLQTRYPKLFGGTWSTSPDPSDFHDFTGVDLYAPDVNVYRAADGARRPLVRDHAKVVATFEDFARLEAVLGDYGGQMASFEWVFSPRGEDGRPEPMFDRETGAVDPTVVAYWRDHYDIAWRLQRHWPELKPDLDGKIHLIVGTADTFYLDGAAHRLKAVLDSLGAKSDIRFIPDRTHFDLYAEGSDRYALLKRIAWEMYAVARPDAKPSKAALPGAKASAIGSPP